MSAQHTHGRLSVFTPYAQHELRNPIGSLVAVTPAYDVKAARRLAACWNACEGVSTEVLEREASIAKASYTMRMHAEAQRDELLEALKDTMSLIEALMPGVRHIPLQDYAALNNTPLKARAAIAKAGGAA